MNKIITKIKAILFISLIILFLANCNSPEKCLTGKWCIPNCNDANKKEWTFFEDGTFSYILISDVFEINHFGNWKITDSEKIQISYTETTETKLPKNKELILISCSVLKESDATIYRK